ncbi:MAG: Lar family restriction alleviation protein [Planctomycetota bacterium]|jgi:Lar family restriction alleviation protein
MIGVKECPYCRSPRTFIQDQTEGMYSIECDSCGATGPSADSEIEAIDVWNEWNKQDQTEGWYDRPSIG